MNPWSFLISYLRLYSRTFSFLCLSVIIVAVTVLSVGLWVRTVNLQGISFHTILGVSFFLSLGSFGRAYLSAYLSEGITARMRSDIFSNLLQREVAFYDQVSSTTLVAKITDDLAQIEKFISKSCPILIRNLFFLGGGLIFMIWISLFLTLIGVAIIPCIVIPIAFLGKRLKGLSNAIQERRGTLFSYFEETLAEIRTTKAFNHEKKNASYFEMLNEKIKSISKTYYRQKALLSSLVMGLVIVGAGCLFFYGFQEMCLEHLSGGEFTAFLFYLSLVAASSGTIGDLTSDWIRTSDVLQRLNGYLLTYPEKKPVRQLLTPRGIIAFHRVSFSYKKENPLLQDVTLSIAPGERIAIVGASGVGKSTLFSLILKFYEIQSGAIYLDGIDLGDVAPIQVRERIGWVTHNSPIFTGSIYDNILYGNLEAVEQEVYDAAEKANALNFIQSFPKGFNTQVGPRGILLSTGQRQRIAIARVILKDPHIFLFDEATNALDSENEQAIQNSLQRLFSTRTSIIIAHRLSTILQADRIAVLESGHIRAIGTHTELMRSDSVYRRLANLQFYDASHAMT